MRHADDMCKIHELEERVKELEDAIALHRDQKGDDRCWLDDKALYAHISNVPGKAETALPAEDEFLANCVRFYKSRQAPGCKYMTVDEQVKRAVAEKLKSLSSGLANEAKLLLNQELV